MKKAVLVFLLSFSFLLFSNYSFSQAPEIGWQNTIGGSMPDAFIAIDKTFDGGYIYGGSSFSNISGDKTENSIGEYDYWIIKVNDFGDIQWQNTIGGNLYDILTDVKQTNDSGFICGGFSQSGISGDKTENCIGIWDYWIVKLDALGNIQWQNTIGGTAADMLYSISQTSDGGYICGGESYSPISGDKSENNMGSNDYWVIKLDQSGNVQWENTIGGISLEDLRSVSETADGGYICGGTSRSDISGDKTDPSNGSGDYWIVKLDSTGSIQWQNSIGGSLYDECSRVHQTFDGGFICGGHSWSNISGDKTENNFDPDVTNPTADYWIVKIDSLGVIQWQNTIGGNDQDMLTYIDQTADGGYIGAGHSISNISGDKTEHLLGGSDCWIIKLDHSGNLQWENTIGGSDSDQPHYISQTDDGGFICAISSPSDSSGDKTENCIGGNDYWVIKITEEYNTICGKLFLDLNANLVVDLGEPDIKSWKVMESTTGRFGFSDINGLYSFRVFDSVGVNVSPDPHTYFNPTPLSHSAYFSGFQQTDSLNDFALQPTGVYNDLKIKLTPLGALRQGLDGYFRLDYFNVGTTSLSGDVVFYVDSTFTFFSSTVLPSAITSDSIVWNTGLLSPFQSGSITVMVYVDQATPIGTVIHAFSRIFPVSGDVVPQNNVSSWEVTVTGSVDPNDILANRSEILTAEVPNQPWLEYIIRFQNTGTDTAFMVKIFNFIDTTRLELGSFEFEASSHPVNVSYNYFERRFEFNFPGILLPDSNINESLSHGFIRYRIKPLSTLVLNDTIKNKALIFFDFNAAVETNTAVTIITQPVGIFSPAHQGSISLYPNPASTHLIIKSNNLEGNNLVQVFDLCGRKLISEEIIVASDNMNLNIDNLVSGLYMLRIINNGKNYHARFVKE